MTDSLPSPAGFRFANTWTQSILFGLLVGILYITAVAIAINDPVAASAYAYGFLVMMLLGMASWRWTEFLTACWIGSMMSAPVSYQVTGGATPSPSLTMIGAVIMTIPVAIPFFLFLLPRIAAALDNAGKRASPPPVK